MAHELTIRRSGKVELAYVGEQPWHGLGTKMPPGASIDEWVHGAGMEWTAESTPVLYKFGEDIVTVTDRRVLHRSDTGQALGVVSRDYKLVQPKEVLEFFRDLIVSMGLEMATAGTLFGGRRFWATGYIGEGAVVDNKDIVRGYLLLASSADGSTATTARFTTVRVVCNNTLQMAHQAKETVRVLHSTVFSADDAKKTLGVAPKQFETFMADVRTLANTPVSKERAVELTTELLGRDKGPVGSRIMELFSGEAAGSDLGGVGGTAWGWVNAVTQFVDHDRRAKSDSHRLNSALFGSGGRMKDRALALVTT